MTKTEVLLPEATQEEIKVRMDLRITKVDLVDIVMESIRDVTDSALEEAQAARRKLYESLKEKALKLVDQHHDELNARAKKEWGPNLVKGILKAAGTNGPRVATSVLRLTTDSDIRDIIMSNRNVEMYHAAEQAIRGIMSLHTQVEWTCYDSPSYIELKYDVKGEGDDAWDGMKSVQAARKILESLVGANKEVNACQKRVSEIPGMAAKAKLQISKLILAGKAGKGIGKDIPGILETIKDSLVKQLEAPTT